jgi:hypothetical protein
MKETLRELCRQAIGAAEAPSNYVNRSPLSDPRWNALFERLPAFTTALEALGQDERVQGQFGPQAQRTVALKFVFDFLGNWSASLMMPRPSSRLGKRCNES